jgi:uncharacterized protein
MTTSPKAILDALAFDAEPPPVDAISVEAVDSSGITALQWAARRGFSDAVRDLLARGADPNRGSPPGMTALHFAAEGGQLNAVRQLLAAGADPNRPDAHGNGALLKTAPHEWRILRELCAANADPWSKNNHGIAAWDNAWSVERAIFMRFAKKEIASELPWLVLDGDREKVSRSNDPIDATAACGVTALQIAAGLADEETVTLLLDRGADPNHASEDGCTALHHAARSMDLGVLRALISRGADASRRTSRGCQPMHLAQFFQKPTPDDVLEIARLLLVAGGDPHAKWGAMGTPFDSAAPKVKNLFKKA